MTILSSFIHFFCYKQFLNPFWKYVVFHRRKNIIQVWNNMRE